MSTATASTTSTPTIADKRAAAYRSALARAAAQKLVCYRNEDGSYEVPSHSAPGTSHTVTITGARWFDLSCSCAAGRHHACTHRACVVFSRKHHVIAKRPAASDEYTGPLGFVTSATPGLSPKLAASLARMDAANARAALIFAGRA